MQRLLRFVGLLNLAVWLGGAVFFTVAVGPAFFSGEMLSFLPRPYAGRAAEVIVERYLGLQCWCAGVALLHLLAEYLHSGRPVARLTLGLLTGLLALGLLGGNWLVPKMHALERVRYSPRTTPVEKAQAAATFGVLHGTSQAVNLLQLAGLLYLFWDLARPGSALRFAHFDKLRS